MYILSSFIPYSFKFKNYRVERRLVEKMNKLPYDVLGVMQTFLLPTKERVEEAVQAFTVFLGLYPCSGPEGLQNFKFCSYVWDKNGMGEHWRVLSSLIDFTEVQCTCSDFLSTHTSKLKSQLMNSVGGLKVVLTHLIRRREELRKMLTERMLITLHDYEVVYTTTKTSFGSFESKDRYTEYIMLDIKYYSVQGLGLFEDYEFFRGVKRAKYETLDRKRFEFYHRVIHDSKNLILELTEKTQRMFQNDCLSDLARVLDSHPSSYMSDDELEDIPPFSPSYVKKEMEERKLFQQEDDDDDDDDNYGEFSIYHIYGPYLRG